MEKQEQGQAQMVPKNYKPNDDFKKWIQTILGKHPYTEMAGIFQLLAKEMLNEKEINAILNEMGKEPYNDVFQFFISLQQMVDEQLPEELGEKVKDKPEGKKKPEK